MGLFSKEVEIASRLAREAGVVIMRIYATDFSVGYKGANDPVTDADKQANELIVDGLRQAFPEDTIVAEESPLPVEDRRTGRVWYVDPLDGTKEFIEKNGEFSVMIGLAVATRACIGVVYRPEKDLLYCGIADQMAWVEDGKESKQLSVSKRDHCEDLRLIVSRSHRHPQIDTIREAIGIREECCSGSVGLKIGQIAEERAEVYIEPGPYTKAWDACGPEAILKGAGGEFTDLLGHTIHYGGDVKNKNGLVATNGICHDKIVAALAPIAKELGLT